MVIMGGEVAGCTVMAKLCESDPMVLLAVTVPLYVPGVVGVPLRTPLEDRFRPPGRAPAETEKVGDGKPDAV